MFQFQVWFLPFLILAVTTALAIPFSRYLAWIMDGRYRAPRFLRWIEARVDTGPQNWKQYAVAMLLFNTVMFVFGFVVLSLQPVMPLNPDGKHMVAPTTIFNSVLLVPDEHQPAALLGRAASFLFQPVVLRFAGTCSCRLAWDFAVWWRSSAPCAASRTWAISIWTCGESCAYTFVPAALVMGVLLMADGMPMTLDGSAKVATVEPGAMGTDDNGQPQLQQEIARGPVAAILPIKHLGTNGGGFFGANSSHPTRTPAHGATCSRS